MMGCILMVVTFLEPVISLRSCYKTNSSAFFFFFVRNYGLGVRAYLKFSSHESYLLILEASNVYWLLL